jgi:hypothetical protein
LLRRKTISLHQHASFNLDLGLDLNLPLVGAGETGRHDHVEKFAGRISGGE